MILHSHRLAISYNCLASTGILSLQPGSTNTVPGLVKFSLDIRCKEDERLMQFEDQLRIDFEKISKGHDPEDLDARAISGKGCQVQWSLDAPSSSVVGYLPTYIT